MRPWANLSLPFANVLRFFSLPLCAIRPEHADRTLTLRELSVLEKHCPKNYAISKCHLAKYVYIELRKHRIKSWLYKRISREKTNFSLSAMKERKWKNWQHMNFVKLLYTQTLINLIQHQNYIYISKMKKNLTDRVFQEFESIIF